MYFQVKQDVYWGKNIERKLILSVGNWLVIKTCLCAMIVGEYNKTNNNKNCTLD